jgi:alpha-tubulin suppressor-like RCC1 family protein
MRHNTVGSDRNYAVETRLPVTVRAWTWTIAVVIGLVGLSAQPARAALIYAWGWNAYGQVGDGTTTDRHTSVAVTGMGSGVTAIAGCGYHSLAMQDGAIYAWGYNDLGELGDGTSGNVHTTPVTVSGLTSGVTAITGGYRHSLAVKNGTLYAWGDNEYGQIGDGTTTDRHMPTAVPGLGSGITAIAGGDNTSLAVQNGALYAWGWNDFGELGDGTNGYGHHSTTPTVVTGMNSGVTAIAGGGNHTLAIRSGLVYAWGRNLFGEIGDGTTAERDTPVAVSGLGSGVTAITGGSGHSLAVKNGAVYAWGWNEFGQLGDGTTTNHSTPELVTGLSDITGVAAGSVSSYALASDGSLWVWGYNPYGELGLGNTATRLTPTHLFAPAGFKFTSIDSDAVGRHVLAMVEAVPEPSAASLFILGGLALLRRRPTTTPAASSNRRDATRLKLGTTTGVPN